MVQPDLSLPLTGVDGRGEPRESGLLEVAPGHRIYWARYGTAGGEPALLLHGGPGSGFAANQVALFDDERFDIVTFDQRGCGRSEVFGSLDRNGPLELVADIECLRRRLGIERWLVVGGSWGATLALAYAERHPARVARLVLWGVWLFRPEDVDWYLHAPRAFLPEAWQRYADAAGWRSGMDLLACYMARVFDDDEAVHAPAAAAWKTFERLRAVPAGLGPPAVAAGPETTNMARIMLHFMGRHARGGVLDLLGAADRLAGIAGLVVHGRFDLVTPYSGAIELCRRWRSSQLIPRDTRGHNVLDPEIEGMVVAAIHT